MVERRRNQEEPFPRRIEPQISIKSRKAPGKKEAADWIAELHIPGLRVISYITKNEIKLRTIERDNVAGKFEEICQNLRNLSPKKSLILDGQIVCGNGHAGSGAAKRRAHQTELQQKLDPIGPCYLLVNDVLFANGQKMMNKSLEERKKVLEKIIPERQDLIIPVPHSQTDHKQIRRIARELKIREVSYRRKSAPYKPGSRSRDWLRVPVR